MKFFTHMRTGLAVVALAAMNGSAHSQDKITLKVLGQPIASGAIQKNKEQPFFLGLAESSGLPVTVEYKPIDTTGIKDVDQLRLIKSGLFDVVSLRMSAISRDEPATLGLDLVGAAPDFKSAREVANAYFDVLDRRLQKQFQAKLLGIWPFGPQVLFCRKPVERFNDVKGLKVRVFDQIQAKFFQSLGATAVPMSFPETHQALSLGVVDCGLTGPASANAAGWPEVTTHVLPIGLQFGMNGYGIGLGAWNKFKPAQRSKLRAMIDTLIDDIWRYSEELAVDASNCNSGKDPCTSGKRYKLTSVPVSSDDIELVRKAMRDSSLPNWAEQCDRIDPACSANWRKTVGPIVGLK
jgi:TRAP-type C4-dicarboxylate transport system substrate-binding protein